MSAGQTSPKKSNIQSYKFLTFFYCVTDVAKCHIKENFVKLVVNICSLSDNNGYFFFNFKALYNSFANHHKKST